MASRDAGYVTIAVLVYLLIGKTMKLHQIFTRASTKPDDIIIQYPKYKFKYFNV